MIFQCSTLPGSRLCPGQVWWSFWGSRVSMGFANGPVEVASISSLRAPGIIHQTCHRFRWAEWSAISAQVEWSCSCQPCSCWALHGTASHGIQSWNQRPKKHLSPIKTHAKMQEPSQQDKPLWHYGSLVAICCMHTWRVAGATRSFSLLWVSE